MRSWLQPLWPLVTASITYGHSLLYLWLQPRLPVVTAFNTSGYTASITCGYSLGYLRLQAWGGCCMMRSAAPRVARVGRATAQHAWHARHAWHAWPASRLLKVPLAFRSGVLLEALQQLGCPRVYLSIYLSSSPSIYGAWLALESAALSTPNPTLCRLSSGRA